MAARSPTPLLTPEEHPSPHSMRTRAWPPHEVAYSNTPSREGNCRMESSPASTTPPDSWEYTLTLPHSALGPGIARSTVRSILVRHALDDLADTAELLTGELCGNAYRHTVGPASVQVSWGKGTLYVGVRDTSSAPPRQVRPDGSFEDGRGLLLVSLCAHAWGSRPSHSGKVTWFELRE